ncbi:helix-turn-helix domain-containing protein [Methyloceanibacter caenitepidi]|uniref:Transcriptional regulator, Cro/CI family n=1 Tax=Methyloceanibacter caenitepidi TaxID=1384459 RepID=A0A0A8K354_9HYPH|nr:helix-turn-helix transcriptional regulator [Methyloceanibacter caenitepidi]BAQ16962.1 transcriptional regulator, Cro/CI family [Methyloceanibacter caenitepidi]
MDGRRERPKKTGPVDGHVGRRIRLRRMQVGLSQTDLGDALGLTFQQIQKYENGANRIGAGRLVEIAAVLGIEVGWFFEDAPAPERGAPIGAAAAEDPLALLATRDGLALAEAFGAITDPRQRRAVLQLVRSMAGLEQEQFAEAA